MKRFADTYTELLESLLSNKATREINARTNTGIRVGDPVSFTVDLSNGELPMCGIRKTYPKTAAAEVAWFLQGRQDVQFIKAYAPIWDKFVENDGTTIEAAYGYRWRNHFKRDQIDLAIKTLVANPTDRRIFVSAWDPSLDGLGRPSKNVPCPLGFTLSITDGKLNSTLLIRSSDVFVGLPYDVMGHALLVTAMMASMRYQGVKDLKLGKMHVTLAHPHLYEPHLEMADKALNSVPYKQDDWIAVSTGIQLPQTWTVGRICSVPDAYVSEVVRRTSDLKAICAEPEYACRPELVI
jgi:thymidylate synthase